MNQNILVLSAGRRAKLVEYFQREASAARSGAKVLAADMTPALSAACQIADQCFNTLPIADEGYIDHLIGRCQSHDVRVVIPTIDTDLRLLSEARKRFKSIGTEVIVSDKQLVCECRDKRLTKRVFERHGVSFPAEADPRDSGAYPLIAKPYDGSCSQGLFIANQKGELPASVHDNPKMLFQSYLSPDHHDEYTIDMYFDRSGNLVCGVPRLRVATRAGEVSKSQTTRLPALEAAITGFHTMPGARGCLTMQVFLNRESQQVFGIEINPRFGGGYPLSYEAGANFPGWIIAEYLNHERVDRYDSWTDQLTMLRYDAHVLTRRAA